MYRRLALVATVVVFPILACAGIDQDRIPTWTAREVLRIGEVDDSAVGLTAVGDIAIGPQGWIYVSQWRENVIRVFDQNGQPVQTIGRSGQGPGEFSMLGEIGFLGDTLYASDLTQYRVTLFSHTGDVLATLGPWQRTRGPGMRPAVPSTLLSDGTYLAWPQILAGRVELGRPLLRVTRDGAVLDTVIVMQGRNTELVLNLPGGHVRFMLQPLRDDPLFGSSAQAQVAAVVERSEASGLREGEYRITRIDFTGDTLASSVLTGGVRRIPRSVVDSIVAALSQSPDMDRRTVLDALYVPSSYPPVTAMAVATNGDIWIRLDPAGSPRALWRVLDVELRTLATVPLPAGFDPEYIAGDRIWGVDHDEWDIPYVVVYEIRRGPGSG